MPKGRHKRRQPTSVILHKKRLISRKPKYKKVEIVSRKGQPQITARVPALRRQAFELEAVSSSWIADLGYDKENRLATMVLLDGKIYHFQIPFKLFEAWYYSHSKGTFFNSMIKDKYPYRRIR